MGRNPLTEGRTGWRLIFPVLCLSILPTVTMSGVPYENTKYGREAGHTARKHGASVFIGDSAGFNTIGGGANTFIGFFSGLKTTNGSENVFVGPHTGEMNTSGSKNVFIGAESGKANTTGSGNVYLGYNAGQGTQGSNQLIIANTSTNRPLVFGKFDTSSLYINGRLETAEGNPSSFIINTGYGNDAQINGGYFIGQRALGTNDNPLPVQNNNGLAVFGGQGYDGSTFTNAHGGMTVRAAGNWNAQNHGTYLTFHTTPSGTSQADYAERLRIDAAGNVGIGTSSPSAKLAVNGRIKAKTIEVTIAGWPDYVFEDEYSLMPLDQVEKFIEEKGHLPRVPSQKDLEEGGLDLAKMNALLMEKVEELTLHTIRQQKEIDQLREKVMGKL